MIYIPDFIYENLPKLYILLAILGIISPETYGRLSGIGLLLITYHIRKLRKEYRANVVTES